MLLQAVRTLIAEARSERSTLSADSGERQFYLRVEGAAEEVLQPQVAVSRDTAWLDRQASAFRDGYLHASTMLANAATAPEPPLLLPLPEFRPHPESR
jgi:hypothetical protein